MYRLLATIFTIQFFFTACTSDEVNSVYDIDGTDVNFIETGPPNSILPTVILLHGASFEAKDWENFGVLDALAALDVHSVAIDLPDQDQFNDRRSNLVGIFDLGQGVVVVSPSMSGEYSLALISEDKSNSMVGFVAVAPVDIDQFASSVDSPINLKTLIIWGDNDEVIPIEKADTLSKQFDSVNFEVIADSGHAPYSAKPIVFVELVEEFVSSLG